MRSARGAIAPLAEESHCVWPIIRAFQVDAVDQEFPGGEAVFSVFDALFLATVFLAGLFDCIKKDSQLRMSSRPYVRDASHTASRLTARSI